MHLLIVIAITVAMLVGVCIGLRIGRGRMDRYEIELQRVVQSDMTQFIRNKGRVPPPSMLLSNGFIFEETRVSKFRSFMWNVYMKAIS